MQHILGLVRRCVEDYNMIETGETVAVGVSGGKDSLLTLTALARLRAVPALHGRRSAFDFRPFFRAKEV